MIFTTNLGRMDVQKCVSPWKRKIFLLNMSKTMPWRRAQGRRCLSVLPAHPLRPVSSACCCRPPSFRNCCHLHVWDIEPSNSSDFPGLLKETHGYIFEIQKWIKFDAWTQEAYGLTELTRRWINNRICSNEGHQKSAWGGGISQAPK